MSNHPDSPDNHDSHRLGELDIEAIARIDNVIAGGSGFILSDNLESDTALEPYYIDSIGDFTIGAPFKIKFTMLMFCVSGSMEVQLNLVRHTLRRGQMLMVHEGTVAMGHYMDPSLRLVLMGFTRRFVDTQPPSRQTNMLLGSLIETPLISLSASDMTDVITLYRVVRSRMVDPAFPLKNELVWSTLQSISCIIGSRLADTPQENTHLSHGQLIAREFIRAVGRHATTHRDIGFYARQLCISPKHLGQIIAEVTSETPRHWICRQVILEAKALLDDPKLTIQQVSHTLSFANQSFFGTFFRRYTGISPTAYRTRRNP